MSWLALQGARFGYVALIKGVGMILIASFGLMVVHNLQASAARKVKIHVMEQVAKKNAKIQKEDLKQAKLEGRLAAEQAQRSLTVNERYEIQRTDDVLTCPLERLRCETL